MGIFSKKTFECTVCGKEYQTRIAMGENICPECKASIYNEKAKIESQIRGYMDYALDLMHKSYTLDEMKEILDRKQNILEKYKNEYGISRAELKEAGENYKKLSDEECANVLIRMKNSLLNVTIGAAYNDYFFAPTSFGGTIVDVEDVFAVGFTHYRKGSTSSDEVIVCSVFTNDPYLPVFPMLFTGKIGYFALTKSKKGRDSIAASFECLCPNLTYKVTDIKELKKTIKNEGNVKGNIELKQMLDYISKTESNYGIFNPEKMFDSVTLSSAEMLDSIGYIVETTVNELLKMDKMLNRNFWNKQIQKLSKE